MDQFFGPRVLVLLFLFATLPSSGRAADLASKVQGRWEEVDEKGNSKEDGVAVVYYGLSWWGTTELVEAHSGTYKVLRGNKVQFSAADGETTDVFEMKFSNGFLVARNTESGEVRRFKRGVPLVGWWWWGERLLCFESDGGCRFGRNVFNKDGAPVAGKWTAVDLAKRLYRIEWRMDVLRNAAFRRTDEL